jgi:hypothetical protein
LTIEFNELALPGGTVPFRAWLKSIDTPVNGLWWLIPSDPGWMQPVHSADVSATGDVSPIGKVKLDANPGVAVLGVRLQESFDLIPGTRMTWITSDNVQN